MSARATSQAGSDSSSVRVNLQAASAARTRRETGDIQVDRVLSGNDSVSKTVTYSFADKGVAAGDPVAQKSQSLADRQRVRDALSYYATVANVEFVEVRAGGDIEYPVAAMPAPSAVREANSPEGGGHDDGSAASRERAQAEAATQQAQAQAAAAQAAVERPRQSDDLLGLNLPDPDGQGSQPILA
ncbi:zinc metalloprotease [Rubrivivax gelatinosus]|uniref:hypothetical protein n=1 Tax=Rubrivivax gelatinosus TaxID=28068 RepID=UPI0031F724F1